MDSSESFLQTEIQRRKFLEWISLSSLALALPAASWMGCSPKADVAEVLPDFKNVFDLEAHSLKVMGENAIEYLNGGADDLRTVRANAAAYSQIQIRERRLIDVTTVSTQIELFGQTLSSPLILSPF